MTPPDGGRLDRVALSISQRNIYNGVLQDPDPSLYLIGKSYRFHPIALLRFRSALAAIIRDNPIQLCVLTTQSGADGYPELVARLRWEDLVCVRSDDGVDVDGPQRGWTPGVLDTPLVRYTVCTDAQDRVVAMHVHAHHILLDGASTAIIEADLARHLGDDEESPRSATTLASVAAAHQAESAKVTESVERLSAAVHHELAERAQFGDQGHGPDGAVTGTAGRGVMQESVRVAGSAYESLIALAETRSVPLDALVTTAALAVHASLRRSTESLLVHPVDNRFGSAELNVATCLVNSVAHSVRFPPFASIADVVTAVDRGYVKAVRRRWFREERYRRMYLALNRGAHVEALTVNFMRGRCADQLAPYLSEPPVVTDIGPVEGLTVACTHDEVHSTLDIAIWDRADAVTGIGRSDTAERIAAALASMPTHWDEPIARVVGEWFELDAEGRLESGAALARSQWSAPAAWFLDPAVDAELCRSPGVDHWISEIISAGVDLGDILVFADDGAQGTIELLIACHLAGCGYSPCATADELNARVEAVTAQGGVVAHRFDLVRGDPAPSSRELVEDRIDRVAHDRRLADRLAYVMPTSGSTGVPKLVPVTHGSLAVWCAAARSAYGWGPADTVLQCATLTSDISVEEVFVALSAGARVVRSAAMRVGDLSALVRDVAVTVATVLDLPTAIWHLLCEDNDAVAGLGGSALRQVIIGGEEVRSGAVDTWLGSPDTERISLVSTYGPTETTVVVTRLALGVGTAQARGRLGCPLVPGSVFVAFGEVVVVGDLVSAGYLGADGANFGTVRTLDGSQLRVFATADRVGLDDAGFPILTGRRDAVVKVAGKRVDTADLLRRVAADPEVSDVAIEPTDGALGIWIQTRRTRAGDIDPTAIARIGAIARSLAVPSFAVVGVPMVPRKPNGKVDRAKLPVTSEFPGAGVDPDTAGELAAIWSRLLGRTITPDSSLLDEGIGSLDLIRILPDTRRYLGWQLSILDLISADTADNVIGRRPAGEGWMDDATAIEISHDLDALEQPWYGPSRLPIGSAQTIVILGATGILGTGFARVIADLKSRGDCRPEVVFVTRSPLPKRDPWSTLRHMPGVRFARLPDGFGVSELAALLDDVGAGTVVNCIGNTNVLVPYRALRAANVDAVSSIAGACARRGARLVHLSTFVVDADATATRVTNPSAAPYPYAASKSLAELVISGTPDELDFTVVRLPRVLGERHQLDRSSDILVSVVDACIAVQACPVVPLIEEVTTSMAAAQGILGLLPALSSAPGLGRGLTVLRGEKVHYTEFLGGFGLTAIDVADWKYRLDQSAWAREKPSRWAVIDAWIGLGTRLAGRSYADYLAGRPTVEIEYESVAEVAGAPPSLRDLLSLNPLELSGTDGAVPTTGEEGRDRPPTGCRW